MKFKKYLLGGVLSLGLAGGMINSINSKSLESKVLSEPVSSIREPQKYAVLVCGDIGFLYKQSLSLAYQVLLENGFKRDNVFILDYEGEQTPFHPVEGPASRENFIDFIDKFKEDVREDDFLFMYVTAHGNRIKDVRLVDGKIKEEEVSIFQLLDNYLTEEELEKKVGALGPGRGVFVFDNCNSGGLAERMGKGNYIGISSSKADQLSYSNTFALSFFGSWRDSAADKNKDGRISIAEAFKYARENDKNTLNGKQNPQIYGNDPNEVFLDF